MPNKAPGRTRHSAPLGMFVREPISIPLVANRRWRSEEDDTNKRVGFGPRLGAALIDVVVVMILGTLLGGMLGSALDPGAGAIAGSSRNEGAAALA